MESYGTVVLEGGPAGQTRTEKVQDAEEEKLTNAIVKITRAGKRVVYVLKGHGEREIGSTDRAGFSQAKEQMEKANYEVKDLFLARDPKIPDDAAIVMVPSPKTDLFPQELAALDGYIAKAGKVFFMAAPFQAETTTKYLTKYGIVVDEDVVIELNPIGQLFGVGPLVPVVGQYEPHPITKDMAGVMTLFPLTRSLAPAKALPKGVQASSLAQTSRQSWGETDKNVFQTGKATPDPNEKTGPLAVALVATVDAQPDPKAEGDAAKKAPKARIVVVGTADFASNQFLGAQGNRDFFLNIVSWLAEEEDLISIRAKDPEAEPGGADLRAVPAGAGPAHPGAAGRRPDLRHRGDHAAAPRALAPWRAARPSSSSCCWPPASAASSTTTPTGSTPSARRRSPPRGASGPSSPRTSRASPSPGRAGPSA